jgi:hypothetical protein
MTCLPAGQHRHRSSINREGTPPSSSSASTTSGYSSLDRRHDPRPSVASGEARTAHRRPLRARRHRRNQCPARADATDAQPRRTRRGWIPRERPPAYPPPRRAQCILEAGWLCRQYLCPEPSEQAFLAQLGITPRSA